MSHTLSLCTLLCTVFGVKEGVMWIGEIGVSQNSLY